MIFVFGSIGVDFVTRVAAIPAPGVTVVGPHFDVFAGGKGANQAVAAARLGGDVLLVAKVGDDILESKPLKVYKKKRSILVLFL